MDQDELKSKRLAFLEDAISYFNFGNLCLNRHGIGRYFRKGKQGCIIGRKMEDKYLARSLDRRKYCGVNNASVFNQLPIEIKELGQPFLREMQMLHDNTLNWVASGLSDSGKERIFMIKKNFKLINQ